MSRIRLLGWKRLTNATRLPNYPGVISVVEHGFLLRVEVAPNWLSRLFGFGPRIVEFYGDLDEWRDKRTRLFVGSELSSELYNIRQDLMYRTGAYKGLFIK